MLWSGKGAARAPVPKEPRWGTGWGSRRSWQRSAALGWLLALRCSWASCHGTGGGRHSPLPTVPGDQPSPDPGEGGQGGGWCPGKVAPPAAGLAAPSGGGDGAGDSQPKLHHGTARVSPESPPSLSHRAAPRTPLNEPDSADQNGPKPHISCQCSHGKTPGEN